MKIRINLQDPDGFCDSISEGAVDSLRGHTFMSDAESATVKDARQDTIRDLLEPWVECGEYVTLELDTVAETLRVMTRSEVAT